MSLSKHLVGPSALLFIFTITACGTANGKSPSPIMHQTVGSPPVAISPPPTPSVHSISPTSIDLVDFASARNEWAVIDNTRLEYSEDQGKTWSLISQFAQPISQIDMVSNQLGYAVSNQCTDLNGCTTGTLEQTTEGGHRWNTVYQTPGAISQVDFVNTQVGWLVSQQTGHDAILWNSQDGGHRWRIITTPRQAGEMISGSVSFISPETGWLLEEGVAAGGYQGKALYQTTDGGQSWTAIALSTPLGGFPSSNRGDPTPLPGYGVKPEIVLLNAKGGWLLDSFWGAFKSQDGGRHWQPVASRPFPPRGGYLFSSAGDANGFGWVLDTIPTTNQTQLWTTTNAGASWTRVPHVTVP